MGENRISMKCPMFAARLGQWLLARAAERSSYAGIGILAVAYKHDIPPAVLDVISWWGPFLAGGLIFASEKERPSTVLAPAPPTQ